MTDAPPIAPRIDPGLYLAATPIGAARDITLRTLDLLAGADVLAAEDTRSARRLMEIHGVALAGRPLVAYHDHNGAEARPRLLAHLGAGKSVVYVSEAGTPLVADPGYQLAQAAIAAGHPVTAAPGASAALAALTVSGLPSDRFLFVGFPPSAAGPRKTWIEGLDGGGATTILYESPRRVRRLLGELCDSLGEDRPAALCRELTKRFEEVMRGTLGSLHADLAERDVKGEVVLVIGRAADRAATEDEIDTALRSALARLSVKEASTEVARALGVRRRVVYQRALDLEDKA